MFFYKSKPQKQFAVCANRRNPAKRLLDQENWPEVEVFAAIFPGFHFTEKFGKVGSAMKKVNKSQKFDVVDKI